ncbi:cupin domain-containing protein [Ramlibacter sp. AN1133]|uniref:cupin domain-containing protein n=1 Tax=Ramlibacter sp. AN1133 TaxID=3133429 RepID=UPI0030C36E6E
MIRVFSSPATRLRLPLAALAAAALLGAGPSRGQASTTSVNGRALQAVLAEKLSVSPGKVLTSQVVNYPPGGASKSHRHDADVFAFVLSGNIVSQTEGHGDARVYHAGEGRFERRGEHHVVSRNASTTEPASMLVVFIHDEGATLTTFDH